MPESHSRSVEDGASAVLDALAGPLAQLGGIVESHLNLAIEGLLSGDLEAADRLVDDEHKLAAAERRLEADAARLLAGEGLGDGDARQVLGAMRIAHTLHELGTEAGRMAFRLLSGPSPAGRIDGEVAQLGQWVAGRLSQVLDAYAHGNAQLAAEIWMAESELELLESRLSEGLIADVLAQPALLRARAQHLHAVKCLKRMGDLVLTVAKTVYFLYQDEAAEGSADGPRMTGATAAT